MTTPAEDQGGVAPVPRPPVSPGDVPADTSMWGGERDPAGNWGVDYDGPPPSVADSPHWREIGT
jgi:hypothetical protein